MRMPGRTSSGVSSVIANSKKMARTFWAIVLGITFSVPALSQSYEYVNPLNQRHTVSLQVLPPSFAGGDRGFVAEFCTPSDHYVCISSAEFSFAFPIARKPDVLKWEYKGHAYELIGQEKLQVLGSSLKVWIIESVQDVKKIRYSYSEQQGLLAFSIELSDVSSTFLSVHKVGFGSQKNMKTISKQHKAAQ